MHNQIPEYIERPLYLERIMPFVQKDIMKILIGQRRVGKSYMLYQLMGRISALEPEAQQIYINKELHEFKACGIMKILSNMSHKGVSCSACCSTENSGGLS
ncbi:MAG: hypothetical protein K9K88_17415 [Desulfobacterales bacterium]|nr:hypothetical protein [Desulfobacterales bacterium]